MRDKILHTRVSENLYEKISSKAKKNRITISNLIRNLVEDTLEIHGDIHEAIDKKIKKYLTNKNRHDILGFQEINLAKTSLCENCGKKLKSSEIAYFAFFENSDSKIILCSNCKSKISNSIREDKNADISNS